MAEARHSKLLGMVAVLRGPNDPEFHRGEVAGTGVELLLPDAQEVEFRAATAEPDTLAPSSLMTYSLSAESELVSREPSPDSLKSLYRV